MASTKPSALPPSQEEVRDAFKTIILKKHPEQTPFIFEWFDDTLTVFEAMATTLIDGQTLPAQTISMNHSPFTRFFENLLKWSDCSLQPALEILRETRNTSLLSVNSCSSERFSERFLERLSKLETRYENLHNTLDPYIPSLTQESEPRLEPLVQQFLDTLFHNPTLDSSEIKKTWTGFLERLDPCYESREVDYTMLPNCFMICHCSSTEREHRQIVGTSAEAWFRSKQGGDAKGAIRALDRMVKDVRFHWMVRVYCQQNITTSEDESRDRITEIRAQGTKIKEHLDKDATKVEEERAKSNIYVPFPRHRAWIVDVKSGKPKARCLKCRALFVREFSEDQLKLEKEEEETTVKRRGFSGLACAEDIGVVLCRD